MERSNQQCKIRWLGWGVLRNVDPGKIHFTWINGILDSAYFVEWFDLHDIIGPY